MSNKDIVLDLDSLADERMARDLDVPAKLCALLNLDKRPDLAVVSHRAPIQVDECKDAHTLAQPHIWRNAAEFRSNRATRRYLLEVGISNHPNRID